MRKRIETSLSIVWSKKNSAMWLKPALFITLLVSSTLSLALSNTNDSTNFSNILLPSASAQQEGDQATSDGSSDNTDYTYSEPSDYFSVETPSDWTTNQIGGNPQVETAAATMLCPPAGCAEASVQLYAYLSTPGSFFPSGSSDPEQIFKGLAQFNEGQGYIYDSEHLSPDNQTPIYATSYHYTDSNGQKYAGVGFFLLSKMGILWEEAFTTKADDAKSYPSILVHILKSIKPLYPDTALCHENQTQQCLATVSNMQAISDCTDKTIINNFPGANHDYQRWDSTCQVWR